MALTMAINGTPSRTEVTVDATAQGISGRLTARVTVPSGVTFTGVASGVWGECRQSGRVVTCTAAGRSAERWSGVLAFDWSKGPRGDVEATVSGDYVDGRKAAATVQATWG